MANNQTTVAIDDYTDLVSPFPGVWYLREYCIAAGRHQEGQCNCNSHPWYVDQSITVRRAFELGVRMRRSG